MSQKGFSYLLGLGAAVIGAMIVSTGLFLPRHAEAMAISSVSAEAQFTIQSGQEGAIGILAFVADQGSNPLTTFAFTDPDGIPGSTAETTGTVSVAPGNSILFSALTTVRANGAPEPVAEIAYGQTTLTAGFLLSNLSAANASEVTLAVDWSWLMNLDAAGSPIDLALGQVFLELAIDGVPTYQLAADSLVAPPAVGTSSTDAFRIGLGFAPSESRELTLSLLTVGLAQSTVPTAVPEPGSLALVGLGALCLSAARVRRRL